MKFDWVFFKDVNWEDSSKNRINVDTRDFYCISYYSNLIPSDILKFQNNQDFVFTLNELKSELERLYKESGGNIDWRMLVLKSDNEKVRNWNLKYLRIYKIEKGFLICNSYEQAISKSLIGCEVNKKFLGH